MSYHRKSLAVALASGLLALVSSACLQPKNYNGERCMSGDQCESGYCSGSVCTTPPVSGTEQDLPMLPEASPDAEEAETGPEASPDAQPDTAEEAAADSALDVADGNVEEAATDAPDETAAADTGTD